MNILSLFSQSESSPARQVEFTPLESLKAAELLATVEVAVGNVAHAVRHYDVATTEVVGSVATEAVATSPEVQPQIAHELAQTAVEAPDNDGLERIRLQVSNAYPSDPNVLQFPTPTYPQGDDHAQEAA